MSYRLPVFNTTADIWKRNPSTNLKTVKRAAAVPCQWYGDHSYPSVTFRFPKGTPFAMSGSIAGVFTPSDVVICLLQPNIAWEVYAINIVHAGFTNEYWVAECDLDSYNSSQLFLS